MMFIIEEYINSSTVIFDDAADVWPSFSLGFIIPYDWSWSKVIELNLDKNDRFSLNALMESENNI